jgi:hypothetical protein
MEPTAILWPGTDIPRSDDLPGGTTVDLVTVQGTRYDPQLAYDWLTLGRELVDRYAALGLDVPEPQVATGTLSYVTVTDLMESLGPPTDPIKQLRRAMVYMALDDRLYDEYTDQRIGGRYLPLQFGNIGMVDEMHLIWNPSSPFYNIGNVFTSELVTFWNNNVGSDQYPANPESIYAAQLVQALMEYNVVWVADDARWVGASPTTNRDRINAIGGEDTVAKYYAFFGVDYWATKQARLDAWMANPNIPSYDITVQYDLAINLPKSTGTDDEGALGTGETGGGGDDDTDDGASNNTMLIGAALVLFLLISGGKKRYLA